MRVLEVQWSRALSLVCEVAFSGTPNTRCKPAALKLFSFELKLWLSHPSYLLFENKNKNKNSESYG